MDIFDTHAHYNDNRFDSDREELLGAILPEKGVCNIVNMGADLDGCFETVALTEKYDYIYGGVGIHPEDARVLPDNWLDTLKELLKKPKIVCVGEIGLDYHWIDECPKERQQEVLGIQLQLAKDIDYPVSFHDREAHGDTLDFLKKYKPKGVLHCFSGSAEMAREVIKLGMYIGVGGVVTFSNAKQLPEVVRETPLDRLLLETDAPYMAPVPFRGRRNDSSLIIHAAEKIAELRNETVEKILEITRDNAREMFKI